MTWIKPVIPKTWVPCFQNNEIVTDIVSNPKDLESIWRTIVSLQVQGWIEWLGFGILQKKCHEHSYRSFLLFLVSSCPGLFLGIASHSAPGPR